MTHISTVYGLYVNSDMTEGRGPMVLQALFVDEDEAWRVADTMEGVFGRRPDNGHWRNSGMSDVTVRPQFLYADYDAYVHEKTEDERQTALAKLTSREKELLGLKA